MIVLNFAAPVAALLLLAAHFYRAGNLAALAASLLAIALLLVRRPWAARAVQTALLIAALEWIRSAASLVAARSALGEPYFRLALILGGVVFFTLLAALALQTRRARAYFGFGPASLPD